MKGKFGYLSPEQIDGDVADARSDQFSLGIVLHELLSGQPLFMRKSEADTLRRVSACEVPSIPGFDAVLRRALAKNPAQRFSDCGAFAKALVSILEAGPAHSSWRVGAWLKSIFTEHDQPATVAFAEPTRNERLAVVDSCGAPVR